MAEKKQKLFTGFSPVSTEEWEAKIHADLKGKDYGKALIWKTHEGTQIRPYYRKEVLKGLNYLRSHPGEFPFVRGNKKSGNTWFIRQDIFVKDLAEANQKAINLLNSGVNSLGFQFDCSHKITESDLEELLKDIHLEAIETNFGC